MSNLRQLKRFEYVALKDKVPGTDPAQVPYAATINFYSPGAVVRTAPGAPISPNDPDPTSVEVWDAGSIVAGDQLAIGTSTQARFVANGFPDDTHIELSALQTTTLSAGDRLVRLTGRPKVYSDPYGAVEVVGSSLTCNAATGRAIGYLATARYDYVVSGGGVTSRLVDEASGTPPNWANVVDYPTIQAAIDSVPAHGGVVYIPASSVPYDTTTRPSYTPPIRLPANRSIHLIGDGPYASILSTTNPNVDMVHMAGDYQTIENLALRGPAVAGTGRGIRIWRDGDYVIPALEAPGSPVTATSIIYRAAIRDVLIENTASWGIYIDTATRPGKAITNWNVWGIVERVEIRGTKADGCIFLAPPPANAGLPSPPAPPPGPNNPSIIGDNTTYYFHTCHLREFTGYGFRAQLGRGFTLLDCILESRIDSNQPFVSLESCSDVRIQCCWFEGRASQGISAEYAAPLRYFIEASRVVDDRYSDFYHNITIDGCTFIRGNSIRPRTNPKVLKAGAGGRNVMFIGNKVTVGPNLYRSDPLDPNSIAILIENDVQASIVGGSQVILMNDQTKPLEIVDAALLSEGVSLGTMNLLRVPRANTATYSDYDGFVKVGDIVYDSVLQRLRVCVAFLLTTPPKPIWKSITLDP